MSFDTFHRIHERWIKPGFRRQRMAHFLEIMKPGPDTAILDVGGETGIWKFIDCRSPITILNRTVPECPPAGMENICFIAGDALSLPYADQSFDLVFSNSVIEHMGAFENQRRFASEVRRVGRSYWIQTPARSFPIEPHTVALLLHFLPRRWQRHLYRNFSLWGLLSRPDAVAIDAFLAEVRLLTRREMSSLFPGAILLREQALGLTKAWIAAKRLEP